MLMCSAIWPKLEKTFLENEMNRYPWDTDKPTYWNRERKAALTILFFAAWTACMVTGGFGLF